MLCLVIGWAATFPAGAEHYAWRETATLEPLDDAAGDLCGYWVDISSDEASAGGYRNSNDISQDQKYRVPRAHRRKLC